MADYRFGIKMTESKCATELFQLYERLSVSSKKRDTPFGNTGLKRKGEEISLAEFAEMRYIYRVTMMR